MPKYRNFLVIEDDKSSAFLIKLLLRELDVVESISFAAHGEEGLDCIRALLYMCALQARKCNPTCKALFDRLCAKGKPYRVALIAVANKLLKQVFAIAKSGQPFQLPLEAV